MRLREEMKRHVEQWRGSGLSKAEYSSRAGISAHKMGYWVRKLGVDEECEGEFLPVGQSEDKLEISLRNGAVLKLSYNISESQLKRILGAVCGC